MTYGGSGFDGLNTSERREAAREKARILREEHRKRDRRRRVLLQGGIIVLVVAVVAVVVFALTSTIHPPTRGPLNMQSDGIKIGTDYKAVSTPALKPGENPTPSKTNAKDVIAIQIYLDYQCPICGAFEKANADQISTWVKTGAATLEIHPISILDRVSLGTKYSTRAANAAACMANYSPNTYFTFSALLFSHQPAENTTGLTDQQIVALAEKAKPAKLSSIKTCINDQSFKSWVNAATTRATNGPIVGTDVAKVSGTPTVIIDGVQYNGAVNDSAAFASAVVKAAGDSFTEDATATPTPSPKP
ncbi:MAG: thioredoxin domain-containing protein [Actinomycetota bacterium]